MKTVPGREQFHADDKEAAIDFIRSRMDGPRKIEITRRDGSYCVEVIANSEPASSPAI